MTVASCHPPGLRRTDAVYFRSGQQLRQALAIGNRSTRRSVAVDVLSEHSPAARSGELLTFSILIGD